MNRPNNISCTSWLALLRWEKGGEDIDIWIEGCLVCPNVATLDEFFDKFVELIESECWEFGGLYEAANVYLEKEEDT